MSDTRRWMAIALIVGIGLFSILFFFQTMDPMILVFGAIAAVMLYLMMVRGSRWLEMPQQHQVRVRCPSCRALNLEDAKFCAQCGRQI